MNEATTTHDRRYTVNQEYTGEPGPRYVARFCLAWISSHDTAEEARRACDLHYRARMPPAHTHPGAQRAQTAKRKMNQCVQLAREASRGQLAATADAAERIPPDKPRGAGGCPVLARRDPQTRQPGAPTL